MKYPLGCDADTSLQGLFLFFQRSLRSAEWELASACVPQLLGPPGTHSEDVKDIIKAIISRPYALKYVEALFLCQPSMAKGISFA